MNNKIDSNDSILRFFLRMAGLSAVPRGVVTGSAAVAQTAAAGDAFLYLALLPAALRLTLDRFICANHVSAWSGAFEELDLALDDFPTMRNVVCERFIGAKGEHMLILTSSRGTPAVRSKACVCVRVCVCGARTDATRMCVRVA